MTAQELITFRMKYTLSQQALAEILGITWQAIRFWEMPVSNKQHRKIPTTTAKILKLLDKRPELLEEL
jgi:DNA-binding transcriptional regulator YiaG